MQSVQAVSETGATDDHKASTSTISDSRSINLSTSTLPGGWQVRRPLTLYLHHGPTITYTAMSCYYADH